MVPRWRFRFVIGASLRRSPSSPHLDWMICRSHFFDVSALDSKTSYETASRCSVAWRTSPTLPSIAASLLLAFRRNVIPTPAQHPSCPAPAPKRSDARRQGNDRTSERLLGHVRQSIPWPEESTGRTCTASRRSRRERQARLVPPVVSARCSPLRFCRRICLEATTVEIETLTPRLVSTVATDGLLLMLSKFYWLTVPRTMPPSYRVVTRRALTDQTCAKTVLAGCGS